MKSALDHPIPPPFANVRFSKRRLVAPTTPRFARRAARKLLVALALLLACLLWAPWQQSVPGLGQVVALDPLERPQTIEATVEGQTLKQVLLEVGDGFIVDAGSTTVGFDLLVCLPYRTLRYAIRFRRVHAAHPRRLATLVGRITPPLRSTSITEASSLLREASPLVPSIGVLPRGVGHLSFPFASGERFSRSVPKPVLRSCRLYTGCHRVRRQVSPRFVLKPMVHLSFDSALGITMRRRTVCFRSSS